MAFHFHKLSHLIDLSSQLRFWARMNLGIYSWAKRNLKPENYIILRSEDTTSNKPECLQRVQDFVGRPEKERLSPNAIRRIATAFSKYNSSYNGNRYDPRERKRLAKLIHKSPLVVEAMEIFGYQTSEAMGTVQDCSSLDDLY